MFKTTCAECGKEVFTYAKNKTGDLPLAYCNRICENNYKYKKKKFDIRFK